MFVKEITIIVLDIEYHPTINIMLHLFFLCYCRLHKCLNYLIRFCVLTIKLYKAFILPVTVVEIVQCSMDHYCLHTKKVKKVSPFSLLLLVIVLTFFEYEMLLRIAGRLTFRSNTILALKGS